MDIEDAALMYNGWADEKLYEQQTARKMTMIIADVTNRSFGGKGVMKNAAKMWPLPGDNKQSGIDLVAMLKKHNELGLKKGIKKNGRR